MNKMIQKLVLFSGVIACSGGNAFSMGPKPVRKAPELMIQRGTTVGEAATTEGATSVEAANKTILAELGKEKPDRADLSLIMAAIKNGGDPNLASKTNGVTPLILALRTDVAVARELLARSDINREKATKSGVTPLMVAVNKNYEDIVKQLLDARVKVDAADEHGRTALARAAKGNCGMPIAGAAAEPSAASAAAPSAASAAEPSVVSQAKPSPHRAPTRIGPDVRTVAIEPSSPNIAPNCSLAVVELLLAAGANPNTESSVSAPGGLRRRVAPLNLAVNRGNNLVAERLIEAGAKPEGAPRYAPTPLYVAAEKGFAPLVNKLLEAGAKPTTRYEGMTPLDIAKKNKLDAVVAILSSKTTK